MTYELDPVITPGLRDGVCALWADVVNAGGAVGFVPPVTADDIRPELLRHLIAIDEDRARLLIARAGQGTIIGTVFLTLNTHRLMRHWLWLYTVMLHPAHQGRGAGRELMAAAARAARSMDGITGIRLTMRGGLGLERFYGSCGYKEVGRVPGAIRAGEGDFRDDVTMWLDLG